MKNDTFRLILFFSIASMFSCSSKRTKDKHLVLWYDKPANEWMTEALPVGNGYMGAMFFGGVEKEQIQFTEGTLWSGGPRSNPDYNYGNRPEAWKNLAKVRNLLDEGKTNEAHGLASRELTGVIHKKKEGAMFGDYGAQQTMGDLFVEIEHTGTPVNYKRELDLTSGEGRVSYEMDGERYFRTYLGSYPAKAMAYRFESSAKTNYSIAYSSPHKKNKETFFNSVYSFQGEVEDNRMQFETCLKVDTDGNVIFENEKINVSGARYLNLYHVAATDYTLQFPEYTGNDFLDNNKIALQKLERKSFNEIKTIHQKDYKNLFERVELNLGDNSRDNIPIDRRLTEYASGTPDPGLEQIYFQYSRYLMIAASRLGTMPLNLQGKWNNSTNPPWACDYHMNINQQMLYWPAEVANLDECHLPLFDYMESLVEPGKISAKEFFNSRGWIVNTMNNPFGYTAPGWGFPWGFFPGGAAWLCQHVWEHYDFTRDKQFLEETGFPLMKEAALFWLDYLVEDENGYLVSSPSYSPEHGGISLGASMDHQIAWDLLNNCIEACNVLGIDDEFKRQAIKVRDKILPPTIGRWGQLQEWKKDVDDPNNNHRHVSHLYALHPGKQITTKNTPDLSEAAKVSLNARGDSGTGWSLAWKVNFWARLKDGDRAYKLFKRLLRPTGQKGTDMMSGGGSYSNLLCAHPPFQLDGNMGGCAGIAEMLLQSHTGTLELLPALPTAWKNGHVKGLKARGGFIVDMDWRDGVLVWAKITGNPGVMSKYRLENDVVEFEIPENGNIIIN
ncbi:glycoside hydrolase family 95 protein [Sunxiuqinia rutila]|uniref:glycoside hydrolase family 95 protein n=1 Tax=Sunxiuqinia rutila TaxID=1397841 RepID=UPI003D35E298